MIFPLIALAFFSLIGGFLPIREFISHNDLGHKTGNIPQTAGWLAGSGICLAILISRTPAGSLFKVLFQIPKFILERKYFFDDLYDAFIRHVQETIAAMSDWFERTMVVETGVNGTARLARVCGNSLRKLQTGVVQFYVLVFAAGITVLLCVFILAGK